MCGRCPNIELNTAFLLGEYQWSAYGDDLPQERRFRCWIRAIAGDTVRVVDIIGDRCPCPTATAASDDPSAHNSPKRTLTVVVVTAGEWRMVSCR